MSNEEIIITRAGYGQLKRELDKLENVEAIEMAERMVEVQGEAAFSEDSAFIDAMKEKNYLDERIGRLKSIIATATIIDDDPDPETASPGDRVIVKDLDTKEELTFDLLGGVEVAHGRRGVSIASPVGKALLGKRVGDQIEVQVPDGVSRYKIVRMETIPIDS
jgi:transcription elongation factor GreA